MAPLTKGLLKQRALASKARAIITHTATDGSLWYNSATWVCVTPRDTSSLNGAIVNAECAAMGIPRVVNDIWTSEADVVVQSGMALAEDTLSMHRLRYTSILLQIVLHPSWSAPGAVETSWR